MIVITDHKLVLCPFSQRQHGLGDANLFKALQRKAASPYTRETWVLMPACEIPV
jgi:hypothetical protein